jgi:hypothetical protein
VWVGDGRRGCEACGRDVMWMYGRRNVKCVVKERMWEIPFNRVRLCRRVGLGTLFLVGLWCRFEKAFKSTRVPICLGCRLMIVEPGHCVA